MGAGVGPFGGVPGRLGGDRPAAGAVEGGGGGGSEAAKGCHEEVEALLVDGKKEEVCVMPRR